MPNYGSRDFWDKRYSEDDSGSFDWYLSYEELKPHLHPYLIADPEFEIFIPGCGNSMLSAGLYESGYTNISNNDFSHIVISQMRDKYAEYSEMDFSVGDATDLRKELPAQCFDLVIDKALMDGVLCGEDSFNSVSRMVAEMFRILKPGGVYIVISHGVPAARLGYLKSRNSDWIIEHKEIPKPALDDFKDDAAGAACYYMYICTKPASAPELDDAGSGGGDGSG